MNETKKWTVLKQTQSLEKRRNSPKVSREEVQTLLEGLGNDEMIPGDELTEHSSRTSP